MDQNSISSRIEAIRKKYGSDLVILGHHYQADEVVEHVDIVGDSLELARRIPDIEARNIVFCGVFFMAESAALLARPGQRVEHNQAYSRQRRRHHGHAHLTGALVPQHINVAQLRPDRTEHDRRCALGNGARLTVCQRGCNANRKVRFARHSSSTSIFSVKMSDSSRREATRTWGVSASQRGEWY